MLAILLAEEVAEVTLGTEHRLIELATQSDIFIQMTLLLTLFFSVTSWAIIGMKHRQIKKIKRRSSQFLTAFWKSTSIDALLDKGPFIRSPAFNIFKSGISSLKEHSENKERIANTIRKATDDEIEELEGHVPFLATTASAAPFIGLFGTVWGILNAFWKLGQSTGATSLEIVGPHIAEALSATAFGLFAAIPAIIFYNYFVGRIRSINRDLVQFADELEHRIEDEYLTGKKKG